MNRILLLAACGSMQLSVFAAHTISLAGNWRLELDRSDAGIANSGLTAG
jgi:hypothetical protein